jgi:hypothetical protein
MSRKPALPRASDRSPRRGQTLVTFYLSRDSVDGELSRAVEMWTTKPVRVRHSYRTTWVSSDLWAPGHESTLTLAEAQKRFRVVPDTDLELIKIETVQ